MADACIRGLVRFHDRALRARHDEAGLTILA